MSITSEQRKHFRTLGHKLNPLVTVAGKGLTENIQLEVDRALEDHELIKVKFSIADREIKKQLIRELCKVVEAEIVQEIGHIVLIYRPSLEANPKLSNILRATGQ
ncbi:MAG: YhbY family RNA-binding protein [Pseudomonadales bacterium]|nr:YhbY family RNA-binding protein [Pseudomonadales bacterium]NRA17888.1 YhbY family RNA-binding protein [Oceanospirillaceae bacterium]